MSELFSFAIGTGTKNSKGQWLDVFFPAPQLGLSSTLQAVMQSVLGYSGGNQVIEFTSTKAQALALTLSQQQEHKLATLIEKLAYSQQNLVAVFLADDSAPVNVPEIYLKLHLLSHRLVKPHQIQLGNILAHLPTVAWSNQGAIDVEELAEKQLQARLAKQTIQVFSIDRLPPMSNYIVPSEVSIADSARVYLGAYLGEGTVVMRDGFIDFNAGTEGNNIVMGSLSTGFFIKQGTKLATASSTISKKVIEINQQHVIGEHCVISTHAGVGISLGNHCVVKEGVQLTADTQVYLHHQATNSFEKVSAESLAGQDDLLFQLNPETARIEAIYQS